MLLAIRNADAGLYIVYGDVGGECLVEEVFMQHVLWRCDGSGCLCCVARMLGML